MYPDSYDTVDAPLFLQDGRIFLSTHSGDVFCVDAATGQKNWKTSFGDAKYWPNINSRGTVVGGKWFCVPVWSSQLIGILDIATGKKAATMKNFPLYSSDVNGFYEDGVWYQAGSFTINAITITPK
jgi:outer membrane protein assembly factor BamB